MDMESYVSEAEKPYSVHIYVPKHVYFCDVMATTKSKAIQKALAEVGAGKEPRLSDAKFIAITYPEDTGPDSPDKIT